MVKVHKKMSCKGSQFSPAKCACNSMVLAKHRIFFYQERRHLEEHLAEMEASQGHYSLKQGFIRAEAEKTHETMVLTLGAHSTRRTQQGEHTKSTPLVVS